MDFGTAASIGIGLIKHRDDISAALGGAAGLGKLAGKGFASIAERFQLSAPLAGKLAGKITEALAEQSNPNNVNSLQALTYLNHFDTDANGQVTRDELTQGLQRLEASGLSKSTQYQKLYGMGEMLLKNYEKAAQLDGKADAVSYQDLGKLVNQDGKLATLSEADWGKLNA